jgi:glycosyltransferase involved in cell wall biosynthesis
MDKMHHSMLANAAIDARVIPNGVDLQVFRPGNRRHARERLQLPHDIDVVAFSAVRKKTDAWRDYQTIQNAVRQLGSGRRNRRILFLALGEESKSQEFGSVEIRHLPFTRDAAAIADFYRAADIYLHASLADTFPNTVLEAQACGTPVIATSTGGIPEQIANGATGLLVPPQDGPAMAQAVQHVLDNGAMRNDMAAQAAERACRLYGLDTQAQAYLDWYGEMIEQFASERSHAVSAR